MTLPTMEERYQLKPFKYSSHYWFARVLATERRQLKVLDVGTAAGYLGMLLKAEGHYLVGIEQDKEYAKQAGIHYDAFHVGDIEEFEFPYRREFDYILFADVLEHLQDPAGVLKRALPTLKESGEILVSVPNVANLVIRLSLLFGKFDYTKRGILDQTHLRFFTLRSVKHLLEKSGYRVLGVFPTPLPIQLLFPVTERLIFATLHEFHYALVHLWKTLLAYQFVIKAKPRAGKGRA